MLDNGLAGVRRHFGLRSMCVFFSEVKELLRAIPVDFGGGCSLSKAYLLAELIRRYNLQTTADIGVYRGRSLLPQALAHRRFTDGVVYGIDPWSAAEAVEYDAPLELRQKIDQFRKEKDFEELYKAVEASVHKYSLEDHCVLLRCTSADAISIFREKNVYFDLIHIDGNHDTRIVMNDVQSYVPRLKNNGFVVLDDPSWESVKPAYEQLRSMMSLIFQRKDQTNDYAVFWNGSSPFGIATRRCLSLWLGSK